MRKMESKKKLPSIRSSVLTSMYDERNQESSDDEESNVKKSKY